MVSTQSSVFGKVQPVKSSLADGQVVPSIQHWFPAQRIVFEPGHSTESPTLQCVEDGGAGVGVGGAGVDGDGGASVVDGDAGDGGAGAPDAHAWQDLMYCLPRAFSVPCSSNNCKLYVAPAPFKLNQVKLVTARLPSEAFAVLTMFNNFSTKEAKPLGKLDVDGHAALGCLSAGYFWFGLFGAQIASGVSIAQFSMPTSFTMAP